MVRSTELLKASRVLADVRARVVLVYIAALVPALMMAALQPLWSRVDEPQHADVLSQYAHGVMPIEGVTLLQPEIVAVDEATGVYRWYPAGTGPPPGETDPQAFVRPPDNASAVGRQVWTARHLWGFSYEAMQPPLYYLLAEPDWLLGGRFGGTVGAIYAARLFSALIAACLAPLAYLLALAIRPGSQAVALIAAALAAVVPGYVLNATQITNDGLAAVLGAGLTLVAVKGARDGWTRSLAATCGVLLGAAAMTKLTAVGLVPLAGAAILWPNAQAFRSRIAAGTIAAAVAALIVTPWLLFNLHAYGQPVPSHATRSLLGAVFPPPTATQHYVFASARNAFEEFVTGEPFGVIPHTRLLHWLTGATVILAGIGLCLRARRLRLELLLLFGVAADFVWVLGTPYLSGIGGVMPGRYLYPAAAAALVVVATGLEALPLLLGRAVALGGTAASLLVVTLLGSGESTPVVHYHSLPPPRVAIAVHAQSQVAGLDVVADRVAFADGGHTVWIHVTLTDLAEHAADFPPMPDVRTAAGVGLHGDYPDSTAFPERLGSGESESGWLRYTRGSDAPLTQLRIIYRNVSSDGYTTVQPLIVVVTP